MRTNPPPHELLLAGRSAVNYLLYQLASPPTVGATHKQPKLPPTYLKIEKLLQHGRWMTTNAIADSVGASHSFVHKMLSRRMLPDEVVETRVLTAPPPAHKVCEWRLHRKGATCR